MENVQINRLVPNGNLQRKCWKRRMLKPRNRKYVEMNRKGVCYDVGRVMMGGNWRPKFDPKIMHRELEIIKNDLHCNAVRICGLDIERLMMASEDALTQIGRAHV